MGKVCTFCVMDDEYDDVITFDEKGQCNYCREALDRKNKVYFPDERGEEKLRDMLRSIKANQKDKEYDCIMGVSGGLDSAYLAMLGKKWGLRVLAIHVDDGFDTDVSKNNLKKLMDACGYEYRVVKPDNEQYCALTKAYMKAGVANIAVPQDNILFAELYRCMRKYGIKYFLAGGNFALESILSRQNTHSAYDLVNLKDISRKYNDKPIDKLQFISTTKRIAYKKIYGLHTFYPLNYMDYNRMRAIKELEDFCGFEYYGMKHLENILTAFIQLYWFTTKFHEDKRKAHLSSMIVSGQLTRSEAMSELAKPLYDESFMKEYINIVRDKLRLDEAEFNEIMLAPVRSHEDFKVEPLRAIRKLISGR